MLKKAIIAVAFCLGSKCPCSILESNGFDSCLWLLALCGHLGSEAADGSILLKGSKYALYFQEGRRNSRKIKKYCIISL